MYHDKPSIPFDAIPEDIAPNIWELAFRPIECSQDELWRELGPDLQKLLVCAFRIRHAAFTAIVSWDLPSVPVIDGVRHFALPFRQEFLN